MGEVCYCVYEVFSENDKFLCGDFYREEVARDYLRLLLYSKRNHSTGFELFRRTKLDKEYSFELLAALPKMGDAIISKNGDARTHTKTHNDPAR